MSANEKTDVFQFMSVRSPKTIASAKLRRDYVQDEYITIGDGKTYIRKLREIFSSNGESELCRIVYNKIFCEYSDKSVPEKNEDLIRSILEWLPFESILCEDGLMYPQPLINQLEQTSYIYEDYKYYLLPTRLENIICEFDIKKLIEAKKVIDKHTRGFTRAVLFEELNAIFGTDFLTKVIFDKNGYSSNYRWVRNILFEKLYLLHILRRRTTINLEEIISGLQTLHTLEFLAADDFLQGLKKGQLHSSNPYVMETAQMLKDVFDELSKLDLSAPNEQVYFVNNKEDLHNYFQCTPIVHPIVAQLHWYKAPFNIIKPIGLGDLKVVKQWLCGYQVGEISHIHNVMKGEEKERNHRYLERTEEVFSFSSEQSEDIQKEQQSTERFEMKKEAERVIKTDINVNAHADFTYKNGPITVNVGGGFAYTNSNQDTQRSASNLARDVMDKAVTQVQNKSSQQRSITKIYESEEKNNHKLINTDPTSTHISGIYRWLDKKYKAQLFNYGKRLMFEFIIPEPAAFYVMSKLRATEFDVNVPQKPLPPEFKSAVIYNPNPALANQELLPADISQDIFNQLRIKYDLTEFNYPSSEIVIPFSDLERKNSLTLSVGGSGNRVWTSTQYRGKGPEGYNVKDISFVGNVKFWGKEGVIGGEDENDSFEDNKWLFMLNGINIWDERNGDKNIYENHILDRVVTPASPVNARNGDIIFDINFQDLDWYSLMIFLVLQIDNNYLLDIQTKIYNKVRSIEQAKVDKINQELEINYNAAQSDYYNKLNELNAQTVNDIIQGRSEAFNRQIILEELKKHCITMIAKEFDAFEEDDILSQEDALQDTKVSVTYDKFFAGEISSLEMENNGIGQIKTVAGFISVTKEVDYPKMDIGKANKKAKLIQFLEQAFEWQQMAYIFYPYFWAAESKWVKLMNRLDYTDSNMTSFLKAGSCKVLIAATPHYNDAVMHFIHTREPWEGGPLPVIGDPLFIPLYDEIKKQQDDLAGAIAEGDPWEFMLPTSLVYLQDSSSPIPTDLVCSQ